MTKMMEKAIEALKRLPDERQEELAQYILSLAGSEPVHLSDEERVAIARGRAAADTGNFATDDEVAAISSRLRGA